MPKKPQFGSIYQRGSVWWIKYYRDGKPFYESSESIKYSDAQRLLAQRRAEIVTGTHLENKARRLLVNDLLDALLRDYKINGKDYDWCERVTRKHLRPFFGDRRAARLPHDIGEKFIEHRQSEGAMNATINREIALLRRSFNLARRSGKLNVVPILPSRLAENDVRKGFFERDDFLRHRAALPPALKPVTTFAYWTGCRKGEILSLLWSQVDLENKTIRLEPGETKNDEPRIIPLDGELLEMLRMQKEIRDKKWPQCPWVFFRNGKRIKSIRGAWDAACVAAGLVDESGDAMRLLHDLRRTGVRNLIRAGVPERVAMEISGHKTRSVFDRYNIVSERDLHEAARKVNSYISEAEKKRDGDNMVTIAENDPEAAAAPNSSKLLN
jgi:integrase